MTTKLRKTPAVLLDFSGVIMTANSVTIKDEDGFNRVGSALARMDSSGPWYWADYLLYAERHGLKTVLDSARADLHRTTIFGYIEVARLFLPEDRNPALSFNHHSAIRYILGQDADIEVAKKWLALAAEKKFTAGDLREAMREAMCDGGNDPGPINASVRITDFLKVDRWVESVDVKKLSDGQTQEIKKCTESLFRFLCEVHRKPFVMA